MRAKIRNSIPHFVSLRNLCRSIGLYHALANRLLTLGVLEPDAFLNGKPIFSADLDKLTQTKAAVAVHKLKQKRAHQNLKELEHV
jgi:hypothetical protein